MNQVKQQKLGLEGYLLIKTPKEETINTLYSITCDEDPEDLFVCGIS